jgi:hypothetical protein
MRAQEALTGNIEFSLAFPASIRSEALAALSTFPESPHRSKCFQVWVANPTFFAKTRQRAASYWNCYYRHRSEWRNYPGKQILDFFEAISKAE